MNFRSAALAAFSGILLAVAFPTIDLHLLAWIALVPLFFALRGQSVKNGFWLGGIAGIVYFAGTVHWVTNSVHFYGGIPIIPASLITLLPLRLSGALSRALRRRRRAYQEKPPIAVFHRRARALDLARTGADLRVQRLPLVAARLLAISCPARDPDSGHHRRVRRLIPDRAGKCRPRGIHHGPKETISV